MNILGIGPLLAIVGGSAFGVLIVVETLFELRIDLPSPWREISLLVGIGLIFIGVILWVLSAIAVERAFKHHRLETGGVYRLCRNPLYAAFIVFIVPGLAFALFDPFVLLVSVVTGAAFKLRIGKEEEFLQREYGEEYTRYAEKVAQLVPFVKV
ncbi:MAG: isoprenylcysteine carboxylmethyltransferase family protein [Bacteroidota bacterium]